MMPAAKHLDPVLGVDIHLILTPVGVTVPIPHPFVGIVMDPFDYIQATVPVPIPFVGVVQMPLGASVLVNGMYRAIAGTAGKAMPSHIPIGGTFIKPPSNECEMFMGSSTVEFDGDAASHMAHPNLSCQCIGMPAPPRLNPKKKSKMKSLALPVSVVLPIPAGPPVLIGGPPTISLMAMAMKFGMGALGKGLKRLAKTKLFRRLTDKIKSKLKRRKPSTNKACGRSGEPVDVVTGANVDDFIDYELSGPLPFLWKRYYDSSLNQYHGPLGWAFRHEYERHLRKTAEGFEYINQEGEVVEFPSMEAGEKEVANDGLLLRYLGSHIYEISEQGQPTMRFHLDIASSLAQLKEIRLDDNRMEFQYDVNGRLLEIKDSLNRRIFFQSDTQGHIVQLKLKEKESLQEQILASYEYNSAGNLIRWQDALGHQARYLYRAEHLMICKTDRNGYSYHYEYDEEGRCVRTYGDDGLYDVRFQYEPELFQTVVTWADGGVWTYIYNEDGTIVEISDPYGGSTQFIVDEDRKVTEEIDPSGNVTQLLYDTLGGHTSRIDPLGYVTPPIHIMPHPPDPLAYELPETPLEWEFGEIVPRDAVKKAMPDDAVLAKFPIDLSKDIVGSTNDRHINSTGQEQADSPIHREYDAMRRLTKEVDADGHMQQWKYDPNDNMISHKDRDDSVHRSEYFSWNLKRREIDPNGMATSYEYSIREEITRVIDPGGAESRFVYDHRDRLIEVHRHGKLKEKYRYDAGDNLIEKLDGHDNILLSLEITPGNLPKVRHLASGENHSFEYDNRGRITKASTDDFAVDMEYDIDGQIMKDLRDDKGVLHEFLARDVDQITFFDRFITTYDRDEEEQKQVLFIQDPTGATHQFDISPDGLISRRLSNGTTELCQYDRQGRCLRKASINGDNRDSLRNRGYMYSNEGDLREVVDNNEGRTRYEYDAAHRLKREVLPDGASRDFHHDPAGNLIEQPGLSGVAMNEGNRLRSANGDRFTYNERNNISSRTGSSGTTRYEYNSRDMLTGCENGHKPWKASYDPLGRRVSKSWGENKVEFYWDDERLAAEIRNDEQLRIYVYTDATALVPFMFVEYDSPDAPPETGRRYFIFTNQIGVPIRVEDDQGQTVWSASIGPYGQAYVKAGSKLEMPLRFPGHYYDKEIGLCCNHFRYYSPKLGRYLQSDPMGIAGGTNLYSYPANPLTNVDLDGLHGKQAKKGKGKQKGGPDAENPKRVTAKDRAGRRQIAGECGMDRRHLENLRKRAKANNETIIVRGSNVDSLKYHGKEGHVPKPVDCKFKTAKPPDKPAGLVKMPDSPTIDDLAHKADLEAKGWRVDKDGCWRTDKGDRIYGDHDLQGVYKPDPETGNMSNANTNDKAWRDEFNDDMSGGKPEMTQHGANDDYPKTDPDTGEVILDPETGKPEMGRQPEPDEKFVAVDNDGNVTEINGSDELEQYYADNDLPWPY